MQLESLKEHSLVYLATPYSKYPEGLESAFQDAAALAAKVMVSGVKVYSPISHGHPLSVYGGVDPHDHSVWLPFDAAIMDKSDAILVAKMDTWDQSFGISHEIEVFTKAGKPVYYLTLDTMAVSSDA